MNARRSLLAVACALVLGGCAGQAPGTGGSSAPSSPQGGAGGASGTIVGTIVVETTRHEEQNIVRTVIDERTVSTINVNLARDPSDPGELYVDAASTYHVNATAHTERESGNCTAILDISSGDSVFKFTDQPTSYENSIHALVDRDNGEVRFAIQMSWSYQLKASGCNSGGSTEENAGGVSCPSPLTLTAKLIEQPGADQIDAACEVGEALAHTSVTGTLTLVP